jgi:hypothetical protein
MYSMKLLLLDDPRFFVSLASVSICFHSYSSQLPAFPRHKKLSAIDSVVSDGSLSEVNARLQPTPKHVTSTPIDSDFEIFQFTSSQLS